MKYLISLIFFFSFFLTISATNYYADPINGSMSNSGSSASPWSSLEDVMNSSNTFTAGDIIFLRTGNHGFPKINKVNTGYVDIMPQSGHTPIIDRIYVGSSSAAAYWKLNGLTIQTENVSAFPISLITLYPTTSNIVIQNCTIQSTDNTTIYTRDDWRDKTNHGIRSQGDNHTIIDNTIRNIAVGLSIESENTLISGNMIQYFTIDGIRGLASNCIYEGNTVKDNKAVFIYSENHYDGFQAYTCCPVGTDTLKNVILRKNLIINCTDTTQEWRGPMQGMAGFDGYFENWTIENNIIITDHWHGITLLGAINCRIINNTVVDPYDVSPIDPFDIQSTSTHGPAWIKIAAHKNGDFSLNNTIRNNLTADMQNDVGIGTVDFNILLGGSSNYSQFFTDYSNYDYHLLASSTAVDAGINVLAPTTDFDGNMRPSGLAFDVGAYEYQIPLKTPTYTIDNDIMIYPNPANDFIVIKMVKNTSVIAIKNQLGQVLYEETVRNKEEITIDLMNFSNGIYFLTSIIDGKSISKKLIIKK
jgi:parallel beta-helix repeat protein